VDATEAQELMTYMDNGGNVFLSSQEQQYANPGSTIMSDYFWVESFVEDVALTGIEGHAADPLFAGLGPYSMARPDQWAVYWPTDSLEGPYDDEASVKAGGFEPMVYSSSGNPNSTRYAGNGFKTVYLAFPFEWLPNLADRVEILGTSIKWFYESDFPWVLFLPAMIHKR